MIRIICRHLRHPLLGLQAKTYPMKFVIVTLCNPNRCCVSNSEFPSTILGNQDGFESGRLHFCNIYWGVNFFFVLPFNNWRVFDSGLAQIYEILVRTLKVSVQLCIGFNRNFWRLVWVHFLFLLRCNSLKLQHCKTFKYFIYFAVDLLLWTSAGVGSWQSFRKSPTHDWTGTFLFLSIFSLFPQFLSILFLLYSKQSIVLRRISVP